MVLDKENPQGMFKPPGDKVCYQSVGCTS